MVVNQTQICTNYSFATELKFPVWGEFEMFRLLQWQATSKYRGVSWVNLGDDARNYVRKVCNATWDGLWNFATISEEDKWRGFPSFWVKGNKDDGDGLVLSLVQLRL